MELGYSEPQRVRASPIVHVLDRRLGFRERQWREFVPGKDHFQPYRLAGGRGHWLHDGETNIWATDDLEFDRRYWKANRYQHPLRWTIRVD